MSHRRTPPTGKQRCMLLRATRRPDERDHDTWRDGGVRPDPMHDKLVPNALRIGGMDKSDLVRALRERNVQLNQAAEALFEDDRFTTRIRSAVIEIACRSVADLGFGRGATYDQLIARALRSGLVECPLELGPHLRLQLPGQPEGSEGSPATAHRAPPGSITVASPPLDDRDETPKGFYLQRIDGVLWLRGYWSSPDHVWRPEDLLVFARG